jgi:hypothetical protein
MFLVSFWLNSIIVISYRKCLLFVCIKYENLYSVVYFKYLIDNFKTVNPKIKIILGWVGL